MADRIKVYLELPASVRGPEHAPRQTGAAAGADGEPAASAGAEAAGAAHAGGESAAGGGDDAQLAAFKAGAAGKPAVPGEKRTNRTSTGTGAAAAAANARAAAVKLTAQEKAQAAQAQADGLRKAAAEGAPFCEECERARQALAVELRDA